MIRFNCFVSVFAVSVSVFLRPDPRLCHLATELAGAAPNVDAVIVHLSLGRFQKFSNHNPPTHYAIVDTVEGNFIAANAHLWAR